MNLTLSETPKIGFVTTRPICLYLANVQKYRPLTFELLLIWFQNLTLKFCKVHVLRRHLCFTNTSLASFRCVLRLAFDFQRAEDRVYKMCVLFGGFLLVGFGHMFETDL